MTIHTWVLSAAALAALTPTLAQAHESVFETTLSGSQESPVNASTASGFARLTVDPHHLTMRLEASFKDLAGTSTMAHIHCCTPEPFAGNAGLATPMLEGFPLDVPVGQYDHTFDMTQASVYTPGFIAAHGGTATGAFDALFAGLKAGEAYLNLHSSAFLSGEIRGTLTPVPEPGNAALMLVGLIGVGRALRRRQRHALA